MGSLLTGARRWWLSIPYQGKSHKTNATLPDLLVKQIDDFVASLPSDETRSSSLSCVAMAELARACKNASPAHNRTPGHAKWPGVLLPQSSDEAFPPRVLLGGSITMPNMQNK